MRFSHYDIRKHNVSEIMSSFDLFNKSATDSKKSRIVAEPCLFLLVKYDAVLFVFKPKR